MLLTLLVILNELALAHLSVTGCIQWVLWKYIGKNTAFFSLTFYQTLKKVDKELFFTVTHAFLL